LTQVEWSGAICCVNPSQLYICSSFLPLIHRSYARDDVPFGARAATRYYTVGPYRRYSYSLLPCRPRSLVRVLPSANPYSGPSVEVDTVRPVSVESDRAAVPVPFGTVAPRRSSFRSPGRGQDPSLYCAMPAPACREPSMYLACALPCHPHPSGAAAARKSQRKSRRAT
jgi:hypothetical protein